MFVNNVEGITPDVKQHEHIQRTCQKEGIQ